MKILTLNTWQERGPWRERWELILKGLERYDADLVVWDPEAEVVIEREAIHHRHKITPYEGHKLQGSVKTTLIAGRTVFDAGKLAEKPVGKQILLARMETTK